MYIYMVVFLIYIRFFFGIQAIVKKNNGKNRSLPKKNNKKQMIG